MKDAKGHGSDPRSGGAHQSVISRVVPWAMDQLTRQRFTKLVPPGSPQDLVARLGASAVVGAVTGPGLIPYLGAQGVVWDRAMKKQRS